MKTRPLSQTGFHVSCLALGTLRYGTLNTYAESAELMDIYFDAGGRFIDTANSYNQWCPGGKGEKVKSPLVAGCESGTTVTSCS
jgi:aryl-alcohol dehydrogenase-like predicted oxidoreductase